MITAKIIKNEYSGNIFCINGESKKQRKWIEKNCNGIYNLYNAYESKYAENYEENAFCEEIEKYLKDNGLKDALEKVNEIKKKYDK